MGRKRKILNPRIYNFVIDQRVIDSLKDFGVDIPSFFREAAMAKIMELNTDPVDLPNRAAYHLEKVAGILKQIAKNSEEIQDFNLEEFQRGYNGYANSYVSPDEKNVVVNQIKIHPQNRKKVLIALHNKIQDRMAERMPAEKESFQTFVEPLVNNISLLLRVIENCIQEEF